MGNLSSAIDELLGVDVRGLPDVVLSEEIVEISRAITGFRRPTTGGSR